MGVGWNNVARELAVAAAGRRTSRMTSSLPQPYMRSGRMASLLSLKRPPSPVRKSDSRRVGDGTGRDGGVGGVYWIYSNV
jgi:hypothetical protein